MSQTLLIHNNLNLIHMLELNLSVYVGTDVIIKRNFKESKILMEHHPGIDLVVCADIVDGEPTAELTFEFYKTLKKSVPMIITGPGTKLRESDKLSIITNPELQDVLKTAAKYLKITPQKMVEKLVPDYFPISSHYCLNLEEAPCNIYLTNEDSFQKKYQAGDKIDLQEIYSLIEEGHKKVYVLPNDRLKLVNQVTSSLNAVLMDEKTDPRLKLDIADKSLQVLQEEAVKGESGIELSVKILAISAIKTCMEIARQNQKVASLLKDLLSNRASFRFKHIQLCMYICNHIVSSLEWGSNEVKEKLAFVAFFHDLFLTDDKLAMLDGSSFSKVEQSLGTEEKVLVLQHAKMAAEVVQKFPVAPLGSDVIILQHHGMLRGQGFTENYTSDLSPLAMIFIVAESFTHLILEIEDADQVGKNKEVMLEKLYQKFPRSKYVKIIDLLRTISF